MSDEPLSQFCLSLRERLETSSEVIILFPCATVMPHAEMNLTRQLDDHPYVARFLFLPEAIAEKLLVNDLIADRWSLFSDRKEDTPPPPYRGRLFLPFQYPGEEVPLLRRPSHHFHLRLQNVTDEPVDVEAVLLAEVVLP